jgi:serine O-acetyltransferase
MGFSDLLNAIKSDLGNHGYSGLISLIKIYCFNSSFRLLLNYRIGNFLYKNYDKNFFLLRFYKYRMITKRGCDISYSAELGKNIRFPHPFGIVIGEGVKVGDSVKIWQHVTLGSSGKQSQEQSYPTIGNHVRIYEKASILGNVTIGEQAIIGSHALVLNEVPPFNISRGVPARNFPR